MRWRLALALSCLVFPGLAGCGGESEAEIAARKQAARADSVRTAEGLYDSTVFDTISWDDSNARIERGRVVWRASCEKCHGAEGRGDGEMAAQFGFEVPSFQDPAWSLAYEVDSLRYTIFVGHEGEMPNWGLHPLGYRNIDAVAGFINALVAPQQ